MTTILERRWEEFVNSEFVNRESEMNEFCSMLEADDVSIMVVSGDDGVGKSSLLARMMHECAHRELRRAEVVCTETRNNDYLAIMRKIRDDVGVEPFQAFTDLVNYFTVGRYELSINVASAQSIETARGANIRDSEVGDIAGVIIKDSMLILPRTDMAVPENERMTRLTDQFIKNLVLVTQNELVVVFFDDVDKMTDNTKHWVWDELLMPVRDGRLNNIKFVLCGRKEPELGRDWRFVVKTATLNPLAREHVLSYLAKRGVEEAGREAVADVLMVTTHGNVYQIANIVDGLLKAQKNRFQR